MVKSNFKRRQAKRFARKNRRFNITGRRLQSHHPTLRCRRFTQLFYVPGDDVNYDKFGSRTFELSDLPNYTEFTTLFDRFRITGIKYRWVLINEPTGAAITTSTNRGASVKVGWVHDYDDATAPTAATQLYQYASYKEIWLNSNKMTSRWFYFKPSTLSVNYYGVANTNSCTANFKDMIDCDYPTTDHYGIKYNVNPVYAGQQVKFECFYYVKLHGMR